jgi:nucleotide-binding universal stress UspA family protein
MKVLRLDSILVASDLLESSDAVVGSAARLAARLGAALHVLSAVELSGVPYSAMSASAGYQGQMDGARDALFGQLARLAPEGVAPASAKVRLESPAKAILERAREVAAGLIVIGPARPRPFRGPILGNTADHIIRSASMPVLVVGEATALRLRRVVVPIDLADPARGALDQALLWAGALAPHSEDAAAGPVEVRVIYVTPRSYEDPFDQVVAIPQLTLEIEDARQRTGTGDNVQVRGETVRGDSAAADIARYVEGSPTDLLVLGTHGYGALGRALIGSVTSQIVRTVGCPMLLVPPSMWVPDAR